VFVSETIGRYAYACSFQNPIGRRLVNASLSRQRRRETDLTEGFDSIPAHVTLTYLRILREIPGPEAFGGIQTPITIIHGAKTFASVRKSAALYQRLWPQAEIAELTGAGHLPLTETPEAVAQVLIGRQACRSG
jgi:pimeloyl-ACP methyl ester carboxylesterase